MADQTPPPAVAPGPVPTLVITGQAQNAMGELVPVLQFQTPQGTSYFWLDVALAESLGNELLTMASAGRSNLVVPSNGHLHPVPDEDSST